MTITLDNAISIAAINTLKLASAHIDYDALEARLSFNTGFGPADVIVRNGECLGIRKNPAPTDRGDLTQQFNLTVPNGFDNLIAGGVDANSVESVGIVDKWIDRSLAGTVA